MYLGFKERTIEHFITSDVNILYKLRRRLNNYFHHVKISLLKLLRIFAIFNTSLMDKLK
jgi:hypothetical protein